MRQQCVDGLLLERKTMDKLARHSVCDRLINTSTTLPFAPLRHDLHVKSVLFGLVRLVYKPLVLICTADLLGEKNIVPWLISRLI